jgi:hypothetical protein
VRAIPLEHILTRSAARPDPHDPCKWHTTRGVLSVRGPKFFNWQCGTGGGGAIDLVMHLHQLNFRDALHWLEAHGSPREAAPLAPLPATPLRRSERKREPKPPTLVGKVAWGEIGRASCRERVLAMV